MEKVEFSNACKEVLEIFKYVKKEDLEKIPEEEIKVLKENANKDHNFIYNPEKSIKDQNVSKCAKAIIGIYFTDYIATQAQREKILNKQKRDMQIIEEQKKSMYNPDDLFKKEKKKEISIEDEEIKPNENLPVAVKEGNIFTKILNWLRKIFK